MNVAHKVPADTPRKKAKKARSTVCLSHSTTYLKSLSGAEQSSATLRQSYYLLQGQTAFCAVRGRPYMYKAEKDARAASEAAGARPRSRTILTLFRRPQELELRVRRRMDGRTDGQRTDGPEGSARTPRRKPDTRAATQCTACNRGGSGLGEK